ncbi:MAG: GAP family protein [Thermoleophilaceae bacterium]
MLALTLLVASIAIADSLNPSTIAPALVFATGDRPGAALGGFTFGVFSVSFIGGIVLTFGPGEFLLSLVPHPDRDTRKLIELVGGVLLVLVAIGLWLGRERLAKRMPDREPSVRAAVALGAGIMAVELPTALPYFAAIAAIVGSGLSALDRVVLLLEFNVVFISPLLAVLTLRALAGERSERQLEQFGSWLTDTAPKVVAALLAVGGLGLIVFGGAGLATSG